MDEQRRRIFEDLTGLLRGEVRCDPVACALYASDASLYQIEPLAVTFPVDTDDLSALAAYAVEQRVPVIPRGAGSQVSGGAIGPGIIVDFTRHFRGIEPLPDSRVRVQAGTYLKDLNAYLEPLGRYFPPDPANAEVTTIGGMLGVNAAGSRSVRVGATRDYVESISTVLADGTVCEWGVEPLETQSGRPKPEPAGSDGSRGRHQPTKQRMLEQLASILDRAAPLVERYQNTSLLRDVSGYNLRGVLVDDSLRLPNLLVGSEGTLALFTSAVLHTAKLPRHRAVVLLIFERLEAALRTAQELTALQPSACDFFDRRLLAVGREFVPGFDQIIPQSAEAMLFVEQTAGNEKELQHRIRLVIQTARRTVPSVEVACEAYEPTDVRFLWTLPRQVVPLLNRLPGQKRPVPLVEDVAVPPNATVDFVQTALRILQKYKVTASVFAHAAAGQIHIRAFLPPPTPENVRLYEDIAQAVYEAAFAVGGTVSGEHGSGLARTAFLRTRYGELYRVFEQIKHVFDPHNILNPGKIINDDPDLTVRHLRPPLPDQPASVPLQLNWSIEDVAHTAGVCNGCAMCRTQQPELRMCPFFRLEPEEQNSPRAKANLWRHLTAGTAPASALGSPEARRLAETCFNCKQCVLECPSAVDIPHLAMELRAANVAENGLPWSEWMFSRAYLLAEFACRLPTLANLLLRSSLVRWTLEKTLGLTRHRRFPRFAAGTFLKRHATTERNRSLKRDDRLAVAYFVDYAVNYHAHEIGLALLEILQRCDVEVYVPSEQTVSGINSLIIGDIAGATRLANQNVRELAEYAREGITLVCTEPTAAVCLKHEYPTLLSHPDVAVVAERVVDAGEFLLELLRSGRLPQPLAPIRRTVAYHMPCHLKALTPRSGFAELLKLIPEMKIRRIEHGCCGMGGTFGWRREGFNRSMSMGADLINVLRQIEFDVAASECTACRQQLGDALQQPVLHPILLLAEALGISAGGESVARRASR